jgi:methionine aminotransferase
MTDFTILPHSKLPNVGTTIFAVMSALANENSAVNLSQGFPDFMCSERLIDLVTHYMKSGANQYAPMAGYPALRQKISEKVLKLYKLNVDPETEITITSGGTQAIFTALGAFVHVGDEVVIIEPAYDCYKPSIELYGGKAVPYSLKAPDYQIDWQQLEKLITPATRMLMFNNPHNPTGQVFTKADIEQLRTIVIKHNLLLISDEVYEHLTFDGLAHESVLKYPDLYERSMVVFSFGKTYHNTGWKVGYCIAPPAITKEFRKVHQFTVFSVNTPLQAAYSDFMNDENEYLKLPSFYQAKRDYLLNVMEGSAFIPLSSKGSYFQLFDYSNISDLNDVDFCKWLVSTHGVAAIPISVFYSNPPGDRVIRLCFAKQEETLRKAADLLKDIMIL